MATETNNFGLIKDAATDYYDIETVNANLDVIDKALGNTARFETAGGTGTAIILTGVEFVDGHSKTFVVSTNNNGAATIINGKPLYKPGTTQAPKLIAGKAVTVWYSAAGNCFFIKASAEGNANAGHVLAGKTFSNDDDTGILGEMVDNGPAEAEVIELTAEDVEYTIPKGYHSGLRKIKSKISGLVASVIKAGVTVGGILGTFTSDATVAAGDILSGKTAYKNGSKITGSMPDRGTVSYELPINGSYTVQSGRHSGSGKVTQDIPTQGAQTITPGTTDKTIASGRYLTGVQTIKGDANLIPANILQGKSIFNVMGSLSKGAPYATGVVSAKSMPSLAFQALRNDGSGGTTTTQISPYLEVTGLTFKPKFIITYYTAPLAVDWGVFTSLDLDRNVYGSSTRFDTSYNTAVAAVWVKYNNDYINETGFLLPVWNTGKQYTWIAIGY